MPRSSCAAQMSDSPPAPIDPEPAPRSRFTRPPDWRRRMIIAALAAAVVFVITFEAARTAQSDAVAYMAGSGIEQMSVRRLQRAVDEHIAATGKAPVAARRRAGGSEGIRRRSERPCG